MDFLEWTAGTCVVAGIQLIGFVSIVAFLVAPWIYSTAQEALLDTIKWYLRREDKTFHHWSYWVFFPIGFPAIIAAGIASAVSLLTLKPFLILLMKIIK